MEKKKNPCQCNSTACILMQLWPPEVLLHGKPLLAGALGACSPSHCGEVVQEVEQLLAQRTPISSWLENRRVWSGALCALWLSLLAAEHPNPGLCSPHMAPLGSTLLWGPHTG